MNISDIINSINQTLDDIDQAIVDLEKILALSSNQQSIDSFEDSYCNNCKEPCGRSNAEILNCVLKKRKIKNNMKERSKDKEYVKEYLEKDLSDIIADLKQKYDDMKQIVETLRNQNNE